MPDILSMPRELRDLIYLQSIQPRWNADRSAFRVTPSPGPDGQHYFWPENGKWRPVNLLSVNRQIRREVLELIRDRHKNEHAPLQAELDIRVRGYVYSPTWRQLDYRLRPNDALNLHVNLNISSSEGFRRNDGWPRQPGAVFRELLNLLCRFIYRGPSFLEANPSFETPGPHFISLLSVHICFKDDYYTAATWDDTTHEIFRVLKGLSTLNTASKHIAKIRVSTQYTYRGKKTVRDREWDVACPSVAASDEGEWNRMGFYFDSWLDRGSDTGDHRLG